MVAFPPRRLARFDYDVLPKVVAPVLASLLLLAAGGGGARAAEKTFVISDSEGYGIMDCITEGKSCGRIVADAWCDAHGFRSARAFGRASDITGAIVVEASVSAKVPPSATIISCGD